MKKLIISLCLVLLFALSANAKVMTWLASPTATGYKVYYTDGVNDWSKDAGNVLSCEVDDTFLNLEIGTQYDLTVTAYNSAGESSPSNMIQYTRTAFVPEDNPCTTTTIVLPAGTTITIQVP